MSTLSPNHYHQALAAHADPATDVPVFVLVDGRPVIDTVIDGGNHLHYVVRNPDQSLVIVDAEAVRVATWLQPLPTADGTVSIRRK
jgi:hypothetical protein